MAKSLSSNGQLVLVKIRPLKKNPLKYELVYGHRRFLAAKQLGWLTIRAEIVELSDEESTQESLIENFERDELSDYEKALAFERLNKDFHMTYEAIGKRLSISKQHVCNYISMLDLFSPEFLASNPDAREALHQISEHHARLLLRIDDISSRADLTKKVVKDRLTVKELTNIVIRLRSWFGTTSSGEDVMSPYLENGKQSSQDRTKREVACLLADKFKLAHRGEFPEQLFDQRFSIYSAFPPFEKVENDSAISRIRNWFCNEAPKLTSRIENLKVELIGEVALTTLDICYTGIAQGEHLRLRAGGTIVLVNKNGQWKILHEHWSNLGLPKMETPVELSLRATRKLSSSRRR
jgi:ParB/RepB/Spo0J family partition protein